MPKLKDKTTISVSAETRKELASIGKKFETYDDILVRIMDDLKKRGKI